MMNKLQNILFATFFALASIVVVGIAATAGTGTPTPNGDGPTIEVYDSIVGVDVDVEASLPGEPMKVRVNLLCDEVFKPSRSNNKAFDKAKEMGAASVGLSSAPIRKPSRQTFTFTVPAGAGTSSVRHAASIVGATMPLLQCGVNRQLG